MKIPTLLDADYNPYIVSDYHLLAEDFKNVTHKTNDIINFHNKTITRNDDVLFLGDISEKEIYSGDKKELDKLRKCILRLNHRTMGLILGNNDDKNFKDFYKSCGIQFIFECPLIISNPIVKPFGPNSKIIYSHQPMDINIFAGSQNYEDTLNIHGHLHGSKNYYNNIDWRHHIDVYYELYPRPMRLSEIIQFYMDGKYNHCHTLKKKDNTYPLFDEEKYYLNEIKKWKEKHNKQ